MKSALWPLNLEDLFIQIYTVNIQDNKKIGMARWRGMPIEKRAEYEVVSSSS